jgi:hypothetical protein
MAAWSKNNGFEDLMQEEAENSRHFRPSAGCRFIAASNQTEANPTH